MLPGQRFPDCAPSDTSPEDEKGGYSPKGVPSHESRKSPPSNGFLTVNQHISIPKALRRPAVREHVQICLKNTLPDHVRDSPSQDKFQD